MCYLKFMLLMLTPCYLQFESAQRPSFLMSGQFAPQPVGRNVAPTNNPREEVARGNRAAMNFSTNAANESAAAALRTMLVRSR